MNQCEDCQIAFKDFPLHFVLRDEQWWVVSPGPGFLCPHCIVDRLAVMGVKDVILDFEPSTVQRFCDSFRDTRWLMTKT
jgi:hypothetical protein